MVTPVATPDAPAPAGHYEQGVVAGGFVHVSGQLPLTPGRQPPADLSFEGQARQALANLLAIVRAAGAEPRDLVRVTAYIVGVEHWPRFNAVYAEVMGDARPARTVVPVPELHYGYLVEIDGVALAPQG